MISSGTLYLVATPIGSLEDITFRAARVLREVDLIACEDTRKSGVLLKHLEISKPLISYHDFNERSVSDRIIARVVAGENVALICDAGTPAVSDPGFIVVREAAARDVKVVAVPGPTAMIAALSVSGLPTDAFIFYGFLPPKAGRRRRILESLKERRETLIFYESPHRIHKLLAEIEAVVGNRRVALCRELTKKFEEVMRSDLLTLSRELSDRKLKGEITLVVEGLVRSKRHQGQRGQP